MHDPHRMESLGYWGQPIIEWVQKQVATADEADKMMAALKEAVRIDHQ